MHFNDLQFQSTRPRGRTRPSHCATFSSKPVSIHASSREDATTTDHCLAIRTKFQSTRPRGRTRHYFSCLFEILKSFNPRVLAGGRDNLSFVKWFVLKFQSTRPRGRTRRNSNHRSATPYVSIHASSREDATWGIIIKLSGCLFQSTRPRGRTRLPCGQCIGCRLVSIHASSREDATYAQANV